MKIETIEDLFDFLETFYEKNDLPDNVFLSVKLDGETIYKAIENYVIANVDQNNIPETVKVSYMGKNLELINTDKL